VAHVVVWLYMQFSYNGKLGVGFRTLKHTNYMAS